jgi:hypothetical protein
VTNEDREWWRADSETDDSSPYTGEVLRAASPDEHHAMLLKVVSLSRYVSLEDLSRREPHAGHLTFCRVGLLRFRGEHLHDDALALGVVIQEGSSGQSLVLWRLTTHGLVERSERGRGGMERCLGGERR